MANTRTAYDYRAEQMSLPFMKSKSFEFSAGSFRRYEAVLEAVRSTLKACPMSREQIADEMSRLLGTEVSKHTLANWAAESKKEYRLPLEWAAAFCTVTNDTRVIKAAFEGSGIHVLDDVEMTYFEIGKAIEEKRESDAKLKENRNKIKELQMRRKV